MENYHPSNTRRASGAVGVSVSRAGQKTGALGSNGRSVDTTARKAARLSAFASKRTAAALLRPHDEKLAGRVSACGYVAWSPDVELTRRAHANGEASGAINGLVSCKSVWSCPVCSVRISGKRRDEMNRLLAWARAERHAVVMLTLTARHKRATDLGAFLAAMKDAAKRLRQSRGWRGLQLVGSVTATEVTHGASGWHPHLHLLLVVPSKEAAALRAIEAQRAEWMRCLAIEGQTGNQAAFQVQTASEAGEYIAKFGAAEELTLGHVKQGRAGGRNPWQLLADARDGDKRACALWVEYALCFKGRRQLQWSPRLKALAAVEDLSDDQEAGEPVRLRAWSGASDCWRLARRRRCALVDAAEGGGDLDAAEFGLTDAERWRGEVSAAEVLE